MAYQNLHENKHNELLAVLSYDTDKLKRYLEENEPKLVRDKKKHFTNLWMQFLTLMVAYIS